MQLSALHVNHGLRREAGRDEMFCRELCARLEIPFRSVRIVMSGTSEEEAREKRYAALEAEAVRAGADAVAAAHHLNDLAETVMMRLMRGSVRGLGGIREVTFLGEERRTLWRPFLDTPQEKLRGYLEERRIPWTEDLTNADTRYLRNALRHRILPLMEEAQPGTLRHIAFSAAVLREESDYLDALAAESLRGACGLFPCPFILTDALDAAPAPLRRRCLRLFLDALGQGGNADGPLICSLAGSREGQTFNMKDRWRASREKGYLAFLPPPGYDAPPRIDAVPFAGDAGDGRRRQALPAAVYARCTVRWPLPGDVIRPFGRGQRITLNEYLCKRKIPRCFRPRVPVLADGKNVIWAVGAGASEEARVREGEDALVLSWSRPLPGETQDELFSSHHIIGGEEQ